MGKLKKRKVQYNGESYSLPVINTVSGTEEEKIELGLFVCKVYGDKFQSIDGACQMAGIGRTTFYSWRNTFTQLEQAFNEASTKRKTLYSIGLTDMAMTSAERLLSTKPYHTRTIRFSMAGVTKEQLITLYKGQDLPDGKVFDIEITDHYQEKPPHASATLAVLYNQVKGEFERNPQPVQTESQRTSIPIQKWVDETTGQEEESKIKNLLGDGSSD